MKLPETPEATFVALRHIRETALVRYDSLFTPDERLWGLQNLRRFHALFVDRFDQGTGSFLERWRTQLEGATDDVLQLAAELLYVQGKNSNGDTLGRLADLHRLERRQRLAKRR